jgi:hypothetical protein
MTNPAYWELNFYRFRDDDDTEANATWRELINTDTDYLSADLDVNNRLRVGIDETAGNSGKNELSSWFYRLNGVEWIAITTTSIVVKAIASPYFAQLDDVSQQITSGAYDTTNASMSEIGTAGDTTCDPGANGSWEGELCFQVLSADVSNGDYIEFQVLLNAELDVQNVYPRIDIVIIESQTETETADIDAILKKAGITKVLGLDSLLLETFPIDLSIDSLLVLLRTKNVDIDSILKATGYIRLVNLDSLLKALSVENTIDIDALLVEIITKTISTDAILKALLSTDLNIDAVLKQLATTKTINIDALLEILDQSSVINIDALLKILAQSGVTNIDALLLQSYIDSISIDAILKVLDIESSLSIDAVLHKYGITITSNLDAILTAEGVITFITSIDSLLKAEGLLYTCNLNAILMKNLYGTLTVDAVLQKQFINTVIIDSILKKLNETTINLDALLQIIGSENINIDAVLKAIGQIRTASIDAIIQEAVSGSTKTININALLVRINTTVISLDALIIILSGLRFVDRSRNKNIMALREGR